MKRKAPSKPVLVKCGEAYINPLDVSNVRLIKRGLYIVKLISQPEPTYPIWLREDEVGALLQFFDIKEDS